MPHVRTVKNASGARAVQIVYSRRKGSRRIEHIGSAHDEVELELLKAVAQQRWAAGQGELDLGLAPPPEAGGPLPVGLGPPSYATVKRRLPGYASDSWRERLAALCADHAGLGPASLVLFDVTPLYLETDARAPSTRWAASWAILSYT